MQIRNHLAEKKGQFEFSRLGQMRSLKLKEFSGIAEYYGRLLELAHAYHDEHKDAAKRGPLHSNASIIRKIKQIFLEAAKPIPALHKELATAWRNKVDLESFRGAMAPIASEATAASLIQKERCKSRKIKATSKRK
jgi:hypothetical protein